MKVLITGASGFIGQYLTRMLQSIRVEVLACVEDIANIPFYENLIDSNEIKAFVHLAGLSSIASCEADISMAFRTNVESTYRLAHLIAKKNKNIHFIFPSTGQVYGTKSDAEEWQIYSESDALSPRNLYALTKYLCEEELRVLAKNYGLTVTLLRIFNHAHKSQRPDFFLSSVYRQMLEARQQGNVNTSIFVGNVNVSRDFGAIQDLLDVIVRVISIGPVSLNDVNIFNVSSGKGKNLRSLIECLADQLSLSVSCVEREDLKRLNEPKSIVASNEKFYKAYQWLPRHSSSEELLIKAFLADL